MKTSNIFQKLKASGAYNTDGMKPQLPGLQSPLKKSPYKFNAGLKKAAAEGKLDNNPKFKNAVESSPAKKYKSDAQRKAVHASKAEKGSPAAMKGKPKVPKETKKKGNKTITVENFNYGDEFTSKVKTKQKNKKDGKVKIKIKGTSKNYDPSTGKKTGRSVTKAKAKLETYDKNVSSDPSEGTVKKSNIVSLKKSYKTKGSSKLKGKVTGSGSKSGTQSVTGKGLDKSLDNINTIDVRRNLKSPAKKKDNGKKPKLISKVTDKKTGITTAKYDVGTNMPKIVKTKSSPAKKKSCGSPVKMDIEGRKPNTRKNKAQKGVNRMLGGLANANRGCKPHRKIKSR
jgi:hypothetical protein